MKMFAVKDMKAQLYQRPFFSLSIADATRGFEVISNEGDSMVSKFPNDFRLFYLADFDVETGAIKTLEFPQDLGSAADFKRKPEPVAMFDQKMAQ